MIERAEWSCVRDAPRRAESRKPNHVGTTTMPMRTPAPEPIDARRELAEAPERAPDKKKMPQALSV